MCEYVTIDASHIEMVRYHSSSSTTQPITPIKMSQTGPMSSLQQLKITCQKKQP